MRKIKLTLFIILSHLFCFGQQIESDRDGDGIKDSEEQKIYNKYSNQIGYRTYFNPNIADIPIPAISFTGTIDLGLSYKVRSLNRKEQKIEFSQQSYNETENSKKTFNSKTLKNKTELEVKLGLDLEKINFYGGFNISNNFSIDATSGIEFSKTNIEKWKAEYQNFQTKFNSSEIEYDDKAGYIKANLNFYNPSKSHAITISNIIVTAYTYKISSGEIDFEKPILESIEVNLKAINSSEKNNEINLAGGELKKRLVLINGLNTYDIIRLLNNGMSIIFLIEDFDVKVKDDGIPQNSISLTSQKNALSRETFKLRIIDDESDKTYFIAKKDTDGSFNTLKKALVYIYGDSVKFDEIFVNGYKTEYIYSINNLVSNLNTKIKPEDYTKENINQGFWFKLLRDGTSYKGDLNAPLNERNIDITLVYLKGKDLFKPIKKNYSISEIKNFELTDSTIQQTRLKVSQGNKIRLYITPYINQFTQGFEKRKLSSGAVYSIAKINQEWAFLKASRSDIINQKLFIKFESIDSLFKLTDLENIKLFELPQNTWLIEFTPPDILERDLNYEIALKTEETSYIVDTQSMYIGVIPSDISFFQLDYISRTEKNQCIISGKDYCSEIRNLWETDYYRPVTLKQWKKYKITLAVLK